MKMNQLKAGVVLTYAQTILNALISLAYTPIMLRLLGQSEYGVYTMSSSMIAYLGLLNFGLNSSYVRFFTRYRNNNDPVSLARLNGVFLLVYSAIAAVALIAGLTISANVSLFYGGSLTAGELETAKILTGVLSVNLALTFISTVFSSFVTANEEFVFQKLLNMGKTVLSPLATIPVLLLGFRSVGMTVVTTLVCLAVDIANVVFCFRKLKIRFMFRGAEMRLVGEIASYSVFIAINSIVDQINWQIDKVILGHYHGAAETAVYGVASQLNTLYIGVSTAISSVFTPRVHKIAYAPDAETQYDRLFVKIGRLQTLVLGLVGSGLVLFGRPFLRFWAGNGYEGAYAITLLLVLPGTIALVQNLGIEIQRAKNMHRFRSWVYLGMAVLNALVSLFLGKAYGGVGCALGTAMSLILANGVVMNWYYARKMKLNIKRFWREILHLLVGIVPAVLVGAVLCRLVEMDTLWKLGLSILIYCGAYLLCCWCLGMNREEKKLLTNLLRKVTGK